MRVPINVKVSLSSIVILLLISLLIIIPRLGNAEVSARPDATVREEIKMDTARVRISIPVFRGIGVEQDARVNNQICEAIGLDRMLAYVASDGGQSDVRMRYKAWQAGGVLRIAVSTFVYAQGARGEEKRYQLYVDSATGAFYTLDDLFKQRRLGQAHEAIRAYIAQEMAQDKQRYYDMASPLPLPDLFEITSSGIRITYPPLTIAPYQEGFISFDVPMSRIDGYLDKKGDFYRALTTKYLDAPAANVL